MELIHEFGIVSCAIIVFVILGWKVLKWVWLDPKKLEKILRQKGFQGNSYRLLFGDITQLVKMLEEAKSNPIGLSDDIVPRVAPGDLRTVTKYGKKSFVWLGPTPIVSIMDPDQVKEVLNKTYQFQKPKTGNPLTRLLATGLVHYEGDKWAKHRKIINPAFHLEKLKNMLPAICLSCSEITREWEDMVSPRGEVELDVWPYLETLTSDVISRTAFDSSYEKGRRIFQLQKEQAELLLEASQVIYIPGMRFLPTKRNKRMKEIAKEVKAILRRMIEERLKAVEEGGETKHDLLGILLDSNSKEIHHHGSTSFGMSIDDVIEECKLFYFAGQETTSTMLVWTMILLSQHLDWQNRAREEVLRTFGKNKPHFDGLNHLKIVHMILLEVLRLYPPVVTLGRTIHEETKLGETSLPAGVVLQLPIMLMHHDNELWGDDAKEFNPERFSQGVGHATNGRVSYFPFGWGPRICIGQNFAILEGKMALAMILQSFSFVLSPSYTHAPHATLTLQPQHGAHLILHALHH